MTKNGKYKGVSTSMRVMQYQDYTLETNDEPNRRLTDAELVEDWHPQ